MSYYKTLSWDMKDALNVRNFMNLITEQKFEKLSPGNRWLTYYLFRGGRNAIHWKV